MKLLLTFDPRCTSCRVCLVHCRLPLYYELKIVFVLWLALPITEVSTAWVLSSHCNILGDHRQKGKGGEVKALPITEVSITWLLSSHVPRPPPFLIETAHFSPLFHFRVLLWTQMESKNGIGLGTRLVPLHTKVGKWRGDSSFPLP